MSSDTFVKELFSLVKDLEALARAGKVLLDSEIYGNRLKRCLSQFGNERALADFLVLDNILLAAVAVAEKHTAQDMRELREEVIPAAARFAKKRRPSRYDRELELYLQARRGSEDYRALQVLKEPFGVDYIEMLFGDRSR